MPEDKKNQISDENLENLAGGAEKGFLVDCGKGILGGYDVCDRDGKCYGHALTINGAKKIMKEHNLEDAGLTVRKDYFELHPNYFKDYKQNK